MIIPDGGRFDPPTGQIAGWMTEEMTAEN